jgi:hypothetical protein
MQEVHHLRGAADYQPARIELVEELLAQVLSRLDAAEADIHLTENILRAELGVGLDGRPQPEPHDDLDAPTTFGDPVSLRVQARRRRRQAIGFLLLQCGAR